MEAAKNQSKGMAKQLQDAVQRLGMQCNVRTGFVGYRDYIFHENGSFESPGSLH
jgi:hypothetical protein